VCQSKCEPVLERFSFRWPAVLDCSRLPDGDGDSSQLCIDPPTASDDDELDDLLGPSPAQLAPANNLQLRQLLDALRSNSSSSSSWQQQQLQQRHAAADAGASVVVGNSPASRRPMTSRDGDVSVCPQRYVLVADAGGGGGGGACRPRCAVEVLYRDDDKRSVYSR